MLCPVEAAAVSTSQFEPAPHNPQTSYPFMRLLTFRLCQYLQKEVIETHFAVDTRDTFHTRRRPDLTRTIEGPGSVCLTDYFHLGVAVVVTFTNQQIPLLLNLLSGILFYLMYQCNSNACVARFRLIYVMIVMKNAVFCGLSVLVWC